MTEWCLKFAFAEELILLHALLIFIIIIVCAYCTDGIAADVWAILWSRKAHYAQAAARLSIASSS